MPCIALFRDTGIFSLTVFRPGVPILSLRAYVKNDDETAKIVESILARPGMAF
jgi:hypothetical protein